MTSMTPACRICNDAHWVCTHDSKGAVIAVRCECHPSNQRRILPQSLRPLNLLPDLAHMTFESFDVLYPGGDAAWTAAEQYAHNPSGWLTLQGGIGCGKTHLLAAIGNVMQHQQSTLMVSAAYLLEYLYAASQRTTRAEEPEAASLNDVGVLLLDDLGRGHAPAWLLNKLELILGYRYVRRLPTVIATADVTKLDLWLQSRLQDRTLPSRVVALTAQDYRCLSVT